MKTSSEAYDAIVVGSGIGGLTAALTLQRAGRRVLVLEAAQQFGGYLNPFSRKRFSFDTGLHYVGEAYAGGALSRLFDELQLEVRFNELSPDGFDWYVFPGYQVRLCKGAEPFCERLARDFPREADGLAEFFRLLHGMRRALATLGEVRDLGSALAALPVLGPALRWRQATAREVLDHHFRDPLLRCALSGLCGDMGLPPGRLSAILYLALLNHYLGGGYYPRGGSGAIRDAYVAALRAAGAELRRNARVQRILGDGVTVSGVIVGDQVLRAPVVISNAGLVSTYRLAGLVQRSPRLAERLARVEPSCSSFIVFSGVRGDLARSPVGDANVWHYGSHDIDELYRRVLGSGRPSADLLFITIPTYKDPGSGKAPPGHHVVELIALCGPQAFARWFDQPAMKRGTGYRALKQQLAEPLLQTAERYVPGLRRATVVQEIGTPATNHHFVGHERGAIYGLARTPAQAGRFGVSTPLRGLFLCGAAVYCGGITPCAQSGQAAARLAVRYLQRRRPQVSLPRRLWRRAAHQLQLLHAAR